MIKIYKEGSEFKEITISSTNQEGGILLQPDFVHGAVLLTMEDPKANEFCQIEIELSDLYEVIKELKTCEGQ